eukprot:g82720.t1
MLCQDVMSNFDWIGIDAQILHTREATENRVEGQSGRRNNQHILTTTRTDTYYLLLSCRGVKSNCRQRAWCGMETRPTLSPAHSLPSSGLDTPLEPRPSDSGESRRRKRKNVSIFLLITPVLVAFVWWLCKLPAINHKVASDFVGNSTNVTTEPAPAFPTNRERITSNRTREVLNRTTTTKAPTSTTTKAPTSAPTSPTLTTTKPTTTTTTTTTKATTKPPTTTTTTATTTQPTTTTTKPTTTTTKPTTTTTKRTTTTTKPTTTTTKPTTTTTRTTITTTKPTTTTTRTTTTTTKPTTTTTTTTRPTTTTTTTTRPTTTTTRPTTSTTTTAKPTTTTTTTKSTTTVPLVIPVDGQVCESRLGDMVKKVQKTKVPNSTWALSVSVRRKPSYGGGYVQLLGQEYGSNQLITPASNTKLFTCAAAYGLIGPSFTLKTQALGRSAGGSKLSELCYVPRGDPTITFADLQAISDSLRQRGITAVEQLVVEERWFSGKVEPSKWEFGDMFGNDGAPPAAAVLDHQSVWLTVKPGAEWGAPAVIVQRRPSLTVRNSATTGSAGSGASLSHHFRPGSTELYVAGSLPLGSEGKTIRVAHPDPSQHLAKQLMYVLQDADISVQAAKAGQCSFNPYRNENWDSRNRRLTPAALPDGVSELWSRQSPPFQDILRRTLEKSDNFYAELVLRTLGHIFGDGWGSSEEQGLTVVRKYVSTELGVNANFKQLDGSGLARQTKFCPLAFQQLLEAIEQKEWKNSFTNLLPVSGRTGTLKNRLGNRAEGAVYAKTGTLSGTSALSGWVRNSAYDSIVFSIANNHCQQCSSSSQRQAIDQMVTYLADLRKQFLRTSPQETWQTKNSQSVKKHLTVSRYFLSYILMIGKAYECGLTVVSEAGIILISSGSA